MHNLFQQGVGVSDLETLGLIDRTPGIPGSDKNVSSDKGLRSENSERIDSSLRRFVSWQSLNLSLKVYELSLPDADTWILVNKARSSTTKL